MVDSNDPINIDLGKLEQSNTAVKNINSSFNDTKDKILDINKQIEEFNSLTSQLNEALKQQVSELKDVNVNYVKYAELKYKAARAADELNRGEEKFQELIGNIDTSQSLKLQKVIEEGVKSRRDLGEYTTLAQRAQERLNSALLDGNLTGAELVKLKDESIAASKRLTLTEEKSRNLAYLINGEYDKTGLTLSANDKKLADQALKQAFINEQLEDENKNSKRRLQEFERYLTSFEKFKSQLVFIVNKIKEFPGIQTSLNFINTQLDAIGISFNAILKNVLALDKTLTEFGKSVQVSKEGARTLADSFQETSYEASQINKNVSSTQASIKNQIEANNELNKSLGTGALFTKQSRIDQIELVKGMGLQGEEGAKIYGLGKLNNMTAHQTAVAIGDQVVNTRKATGITLDYRKVLSDVAKVGGQLSAQYKNNPALLAQAVTQAQLLGLTLEQTAKMGSSLVDDFAGSLGKELEAELLTGKALNLEQARYYALMGDSAKAAKELMDNVGGIEEYQQLNVLQQKSLAAAIGLTTDELATSLKQQELLKGTSFETQEAFQEMAKEAARTGDYTKLNAQLAQAANGEELAAQASQISNQEKFQMAIEKLSETVANVINGPFGTLIDKMAILLGQAGTLKFIFGSIAGIIAVKMVSGLLDVGVGVAKLIPRFAAMAALSTLNNAMMTLGLGVAVAAAAAAVGYGIINSLSDGEANVSGAGGGGGINIPNSGARGDKNININLTNENTTYVGGQKMSQFNTESQKTISTRTA
jgi:methyl-accepting chemotaxis protein